MAIARLRLILCHIGRPDGIMYQYRRADAAAEAVARRNREAKYPNESLRPQQPARYDDARHTGRANQAAPPPKEDESRSWALAAVGFAMLSLLFFLFRTPRPPSTLERPSPVFPATAARSAKAAKVLVDDNPLESKICSIEYLISSFHPAAIQPPTMFGLLHLDPYAHPFDPPAKSNHRGGGAVEACRVAVHKAWAKAVDQQVRGKGGPAESRGANPGDASERDARYGVILTFVTEALLDVDLRAVYMAQFIPSKKEKEARDTLEAGNKLTARHMVDRRAVLKKQCGHMWRAPR